MQCFYFSPGHLRKFHHSASAPALSSLMPSTSSPALPSSSAADLCRAMKKELLHKLEILSNKLPPNTLDELIDSLGGPDNVAEVKIVYCQNTQYGRTDDDNL